MSRYDDETYLPWYRRPTPTWLELTPAARGVLVSVAMELNQKTGEVTLRRGLASLSTLVQIPWEQLEPALAELIAKGKLAWDGSRFVLSDPEYEDRKRPTSAERTKKYRDKLASEPPPAMPAEPVTGVTRVTSRDASDVTSILFSSLLKSDLGSEIASPVAGEVLERTAPLAVDAQQVFDSLDMNRPVGQPVAIVWVAFCGHYAGQHFPSRENLLGKWQKWVNQQATYATKDRERDRTREDQAAERRRFAKEGPEKPPPPTKAQSMAMAEQLAARIRASKAAGGAR